MAIYQRVLSTVNSTSVNKVSYITRTGVTKPENARFPNVHVWTETAVQGQFPESGVIYKIGETHFQAFKDPTAAKLENIDPAIWESGKDSVIYQSGIVAGSKLGYIDGGTPEDSPFSEHPTGDAGSVLTNSLQSRKDALSQGLYNAEPLNPYIHYDENDPREINYRENFEGASRYLDPYAQGYIFQSSLSNQALSSIGQDSLNTTPPPRDTDPNSPTGRTGPVEPVSFRP